ncbi:MAG: 4-hydroxy-tetrahydrodipicolinate synthase [Marinilabiliales bacterium]
MKKLTGTGVALVTPFRKDESIDFKSLEKLVEHVISGGVDYLVVLGTTGESVTLSQDERIAVLEHIKEVNNNRKPIVLGIGNYNTRELQKSFGLYDFKGVSAVLSVTPYYNKPNQKGLYEHYKVAANEAPVPIILYNVPGRTGVNLAAETVIKLANDFDNIIAVKEASGNMSQIMEIINNKPDDFMVISGDDALTMPMISAGASGVISVVANAFPDIFSEMVRLCLKNKFDAARPLHYKLFEFINYLFADGSPGGIKTALCKLEITQTYLRKPLAAVNKTVSNKINLLVEEIKNKK